MKSTVFRSSLSSVLLVLGLGCTKQRSSPGTGIIAPPPASGSMAGSVAAAGTTASATAGRASPNSVTSTGGTGAAPTGTGGAAATAGMGASGAGAAGMGTSGAGGAAGGAGAAGTVSNSPFPQLPRVMTTDGPGPFSSVVKVMNTPPGGWMIYPTDIGKGGMKHPLFIFGPGGGTTPQTYEDMGMHWDRYGSYGFVIYVLPMSTGNGADMKAGLDWLIAQNDVMGSPLYQHLDTSKVCASGHSQGGITVFDFMPDDRVTTTVIISGGSTGGTGPAKLRHDTMFLCGPDGSADIAQPQCVTDFAASTIPTFYTEIQGSTHLTSGRLGWAATIAWMLWHLAGQEDQWKKEFLTPTGLFQTGIYKSQIKNWPP